MRTFNISKNFDTGEIKFSGSLHPEDLVKIWHDLSWAEKSLLDSQTAKTSDLLLALELIYRRLEESDSKNGNPTT